MIARVCAIHGLHAERDCPRCKASRLTSAATRRRDRATAADRIRSTKRWKVTQARILARDGHRCTYGLYLGDDRRGLPDGCCRRKQGLDVHHIVPIEDDGAPYDDENLRTLCDDHHAVVERNIRRAKEEDDGEVEAVEF